MTFAVFNLLFPIVVAVHNIDEYRGYEEFVRSYPGWLAEKLTRKVVGWAALLLTLAVTALALGTYFYQNDFLLMVSKIAIIGLALNCIGHCFLSLKRRALVPGTLSGAILVLPYSVIAVFMMRTDFRDSLLALFGYAAVGAIVVPIVIGSFLLMGYVVARTGKRKKQSGVME
ncbi:MAG: HXXEE domain-containing protein [Verrucomicrobia bacterium]|nr:HXXEE domain-containing protein [Verrucomicrobiota bacterium]